jgi:uncharacterized integral membrane protein
MIHLYLDGSFEALIVIIRIIIMNNIKNVKKNYLFWILFFPEILNSKIQSENTLKPYKVMFFGIICTLVLIIFTNLMVCSLEI